MLRQLIETHEKPKAIVMGSMTLQEPPQQFVIMEAIKEFAERMGREGVPVVQTRQIGHGRENHPIVLGTSATLVLGMHPTLSINNIY